MKRLYFLLPLISLSLAAAAQQVKSSEPLPEASVFNWLTIITVLIAITALIMSFLVYRDLSRLLNSVGRRKADIKILQDEVTEIKGRVVQQLGAAKEPEVLSQALEDRLIQLEKRIIAMELQAGNPEIAVAPVPRSRKSTAPVTEKKYAKLPDLQYGFSNEVLQDNQNGEQIYELDIMGEKARFGISQDAAVQKYALSDYQYYLSNGCTLTNQPVKDSRIVVSEPGILTRSDNGWKIDKKAVITFK